MSSGGVRTPWRRWSTTELLYAVKLRQEHGLDMHEIASRTDRSPSSVMTKLSQLSRWRLDAERRPFLPPMASDDRYGSPAYHSDADEVALAKASLAYEISCAIKERRTSPPFKPSTWI